jgi:hypothetical protein
MPELTDELRIAWTRVNMMLERYGDSPEYRQAWADWEAEAGLAP